MTEIPPSSPEPSLPDNTYGYLITDDSGARIEEGGKVTQALSEYLPYFNQVSALIGDSLGFDSVEELILFGKARNTMCMSIDGLNYGAIYKSKADRRQISEFLQEKGDENDVLA